MANFETTDTGPATDCYDHSATVVPTQQWACVEWHFSVATNEMEYWLNGTALEDIHVVGRPTGDDVGCGGQGLNGDWLAPPAFDNLYLGWEHYQAAPMDINLWVDAVAISTERVGCPSP